MRIIIGAPLNIINVDLCAVDVKERIMCAYLCAHTQIFVILYNVCEYECVLNIYHCILLFSSVRCVSVYIVHHVCTRIEIMRRNKKKKARDKRKESKNKRDLQAHFQHHSIANSISIEQLN